MPNAFIFWNVKFIQIRTLCTINANAFAHKSTQSPSKSAISHIPRERPIKKLNLYMKISCDFLRLSEKYVIVSFLTENQALQLEQKSCGGKTGGGGRNGAKT